MAFDWDRDGSVSPLPRYEDPRNNYEDGNEHDGLPRFPSTMPPPKSENSPVANRRMPASEPEEPGRAHRKKKKKKRRGSIVAEETADQVTSADAPVEPAATQPEVEQADLGQPRRKKKKKKDRLSQPSQQLVDEQEATLGDVHASPIGFLGASSSLATQPLQKKHKKRRKSQEEDENLLGREGTPEIVIPSSLKAADTKAEQDSSASNGGPARPRLGSPFESVIGSSYVASQPQVQDTGDAADNGSDDDVGSDVVLRHKGMDSPPPNPTTVEDEIESVESDAEGRRFARREPSIEADDEDREEPTPTYDPGEEEWEPIDPIDGLPYDNPHSVEDGRSRRGSQSTQADGLEDPFVDANPKGKVAMRHPDLKADVEMHDSTLDSPQQTPTKVQKKYDKAGKIPGSQNGSVKRKPKKPFFARDPSPQADGGATITQEEPESAQAPSLKKPRQKPKKEKPKKEKPSEETPQPKKPKKSTSKAVDKDSSRPMDSRGYQTGPLTAAEERQVRKAVAAFRDFHSLSDNEINAAIQTNPVGQKDPIYRELWNFVTEKCPTRPRQKIINWCRKQFHNFVSRGTWTEEQDNELSEMIEAHGKNWKKIGELINRHRHDCRDRYRNYLICRNTVQLDYWSKEEEERLYDAVQEATNKIRKAQGYSQRGGEEIEALLNWQLISDAMGRTRTRLQCMSKWKQLGELNALPEKLADVLPSRSSTRLGNARKELRKISVDDKYALVLAIKESGVTEDSKIPWKAIVKDTFNKQFQRKTLMVTWARLRDAVPNEDGQSTMNIATALCDMYENEGGFVESQETKNASSALPSQKSSPTKSTELSSQKQLIGTHQYRTPRDSSLWRRSLSQSARRLPGRFDRIGHGKRYKSTELVDAQDDLTDEDEEVQDSAPEEGNATAPPREPTPSPQASGEEEPAPQEEQQQQREFSVELGEDETSFVEAAFARASSQAKPGRKTYTSKNKLAVNGKKKEAVEPADQAEEEPTEAADDDQDVVMGGAPGTPSREKRRAPAQEENTEGASPSKKRKTKPTEKSASEEQGDEEQPVQTQRGKKKTRPAEASAATNGTSPKKRKAAPEKEGIEQTPPKKGKASIYSVEATPVANEAASPAKRRKLLTLEDDMAVNGFKAINKLTKAVEIEKDLVTESVISSDMDDDMEDIPRSGQMQKRAGTPTLRRSSES